VPLPWLRVLLMRTVICWAYSVCSALGGAWAAGDTVDGAGWGALMAGLLLLRISRRGTRERGIRNIELQLFCEIILEINKSQILGSLSLGWLGNMHDPARHNTVMLKHD
jgi:hypothetical protein